MECNECPDGAECEGEASVVAEEGYWNSMQWGFENSDLVYECPFPEGCKGGSLFPPKDNSYNCTNSTNSSYCDICEEGYTGRVCGICAQGYANMAGCIQCEGGAVWVPLISLLIVVVLVGIVLFIVYRIVKANAEATAAAEEAKQLAENAENPSPVEENEGVKMEEEDEEKSDKSDNSENELLPKDDDPRSRSGSQSVRIEMNILAKQAGADDAGDTEPASGKGSSNAMDSMAEQTAPDDAMVEAEAEMQAAIRDAADGGMGEDFMEMASSGGSMEGMNIEDLQQHLMGAVETVKELLAELGAKLGVVFKPILAYLQVLTCFTIVMPSIPWPDIWPTLMSVFQSVNFDFMRIAPIQCYMEVTGYSIFLFHASLPVLATVLIVASCCAIKIYFRNDPEKLDKLVDMHYSKFMFMLFVLYPMVCQKSLQIFDCREIGPNNEWYLTFDVRFQCYNEEWQKYAIIACACVLLYALGIPLLCALILRWNRYDLESDRCTARYGILYEGYAIAFYCGELLEMLRKFTLAGMIIFVMPGSIVQISCALLIAGIFLILQIKYAPFEDPIDNKCQLFGLIGLFVTIFCGLVLMAQGCIATTEAEMAAQESSNVFMNFFMIATNMIVMFMMLYISMVEVLWARLLQLFLMVKMLRYMMDEPMRKLKKQREEKRLAKEQANNKFLGVDGKDPEWRRKWGFNKAVKGDADCDPNEAHDVASAAAITAAAGGAELDDLTQQMDREGFISDMAEELIKVHGSEGTIESPQMKQLLSRWHSSPEVMEQHLAALTAFEGDRVPKHAITLWLIATVGAFEEDICMEALDRLTDDEATGSVWRFVWAMQLFQVYRDYKKPGNGVAPALYRTMLKAAGTEEPVLTPCEQRAKKWRGKKGADNSTLWCTVEDIEDWIDVDLSEWEELKILQSLEAAMMAADLQSPVINWNPAWMAELFDARYSLGLCESVSTGVSEEAEGMLSLAIGAAAAGTEPQPSKTLLQQDECQAVIFDDEVYAKYFNRYDFDGTGTLNSSDELSCLAANMINVFKIKTDIDTLDKALKGPCSEIDSGKEWDKATFRKWFIATFCGTASQYK